jgi:hypothetical protein
MLCHPGNAAGNSHADPAQFVSIALTWLTNFTAENTFFYEGLTVEKHYSLSVSFKLINERSSTMWRCWDFSRRCNSRYRVNHWKLYSSQRYCSCFALPWPFQLRLTSDVRFLWGAWKKDGEMPCDRQ